ncbi:hypothetical protein [Nonomuraea sp. NPDC002799]
MFLRIAIILQTVALFAAPVTAGLLLSSPGGRTWHSVAAYGVFTVALVHLATAILTWRPGGGSPRPIWYATGFLALTLAQIALGIAGAKTLHVPLGVLMFGLSLLQLGRVFAGRRADAAATDRRDGDVHPATAGGTPAPGDGSKKEGSDSRLRWRRAGTGAEDQRNLSRSHAGVGR